MRSLWKNKFVYLAIAPTLIGLLVFNFYPFAITITKSLYVWSGSFNSDYGINQFVGLDNYVRLFKDEVFLTSWGNLLFFIITGILANVLFPFINAEFIYNLKSSKMQYVYRVLFVVPIVIPVMVVFLLWKFIYDPQYGVVNRIASWFNPDYFVTVLGDPELVKWGIRFMGFPWVGGIVLLIFIAGLSSIDRSLIDASIIDGASRWKRILKIDIPLLFTHFKLAVVLTIIGEMQDFVKVFVITDGGPGYSSMVPALYMYKQAFEQNEYGYASAIGVTILIVILLLTVINNHLLKSRTE